MHTVEEMLAARSIVVSPETVRQGALKFGQEFAIRMGIERVLAVFNDHGAAETCGRSIWDLVAQSRAFRRIEIMASVSGQLRDLVLSPGRACAPLIGSTCCDLSAASSVL